MKNKNGFTLAEVLITLATLGVIAAILVPAIMNLVPDNNKVMARKAYNTLEKVVSQMSDDELHYPSGSTWSSNAGATNYCKISGVDVNCGFANLNTSSNPDIPAGNNKFCYLFSEQLNLLGAANCSTGLEFTTSDGMYWKMFGVDAFNVDNSDYASRVAVDVNGPSKGPYCFQANGNASDIYNVGDCAAGKTADLYEFGVRYDGRIEVITGTTFLADPTNVK